MKHLALKVTFLAFLISPMITWGGELEGYCALNGGDMLEQWTCPASGALRKGPFCVVKNPVGNELVFNGCTGVKGEYSELFFSACTIHDFCYHNEPAASGKSKEACDKLLLQNAIKICDQLPLKKKRCRTAAYAFYSAVKIGGSKSWNCSKNAAAYPTSIDSL